MGELFALGQQREVVARDDPQCEDKRDVHDDRQHDRKADVHDLRRGRAAKRDMGGEEAIGESGAHGHHERCDQRLGKDLEAKRIVYNENPIDVWCLSNTCVDMDVKNQTIQPAKGRDTRRRIDGLSALLDAYVALENNVANYMNMI